MILNIGAGKESPEHWGELHKDYHLCSSGKNQSPIDLKNFIESDLAPIEFHYGTLFSNIAHNGHTVQANYAAGSSITLNGHSFELKQLHFHAPSENRINGKSYPMEKNSLSSQVNASNLLPENRDYYRFNV